MWHVTRRRGSWQVDTIELKQAVEQETTEGTRTGVKLQPTSAFRHDYTSHEWQPANAVVGRCAVV